MAVAGGVLTTRRRRRVWAQLGLVSLGLVAVLGVLAFKPENSALEGGAAPAADVGVEAAQRRLGSGGYLWSDPLIKYSDDDEGFRKTPNKPLIILHIIGIGYMILGLNVVCDAYFCEALTLMVSTWKIQEDVAGATFMAAGGSAPELFASIMGVFIAQSDVGFGTIVGSAVFNVLFVIGLCAAASSVPLALTWWPLFRDCSYYVCGLCMLAIFVTDGKVVLYEAIILFLMYIGYCTIMYYNQDLEKWVKKMVSKGVHPAEEGKDDALKAAAEKIQAEGGDPEAEKTEAAAGNEGEEEKDSKETSTPAEAAEELEKLEELEHDVGHKHKAALMKKKSNLQALVSNVVVVVRRLSSIVSKTSETQDEEKEIKEEEEEEDESNNPILAMMGQEEFKDKALDFLCLPITLTLWLSLADLTQKKHEHKFVRCFFLSLIWIALYSYFLVWWATMVGDIVGIPTVVMGYTFLAAGTSIPDAISSVVMAKLGEGDMAVSSSIGSNVFDILVGLPVPWILFTAFLKPSVTIHSPYLVINVIVLLGMVAAVVGSIHALGWVLDKRLGIIMTVLYFIFLSIAITLEYTNPKWAQI